MPQAEEVAVVTGSSTGMEFETSLMLARNGIHTYATMRKLEDGGSKQILDIAKNENLPLQVIQLDVDSDKSIIDAINRIITENDRIDVVLNNAGYALIGAFEETSIDEIKAQFETNFFGAISYLYHWRVIYFCKKTFGTIIVESVYPFTYSFVICIGHFSYFRYNRTFSSKKHNFSSILYFRTDV
jgi:NAD(P)-dependent dehydrogenase (short-subunit alcohol dehydrogenase family)